MTARNDILEEAAREAERVEMQQSLAPAIRLRDAIAYVNDLHWQISLAADAYGESAMIRIPAVSQPIPGPLPSQAIRRLKE